MSTTKKKRSRAKPAKKAKPRATSKKRAKTKRQGSEVGKANKGSTSKRPYTPKPRSGGDYLPPITA